MHGNLANGTAIHRAAEIHWKNRRARVATPACVNCDRPTYSKQVTPAGGFAPVCEGCYALGFALKRAHGAALANRAVRGVRIARAIIATHEALDAMPARLHYRAAWHRENARTALDAASEAVHRGRLREACEKVRDGQFSAVWAWLGGPLA